MARLFRVGFALASTCALVLFPFVQPALATVKSYQKISDTAGGFAGGLHENDRF